MELPKPKTSWKTSCFFLNGAMFLKKNIDVDVFDDVLQNAKHRANDVDRPPLLFMFPNTDYNIELLLLNLALASHSAGSSGSTDINISGDIRSNMGHSYIAATNFCGY